jgi:anoctamin-10
LIWSYQEQII